MFSRVGPGNFPEASGIFPGVVFERGIHAIHGRAGAVPARCETRRFLMRMRSRLAFVAVAVFLTTGPVWAHHSMIVQFSLEKPITLRGTVTTLMWMNPHSWINIDVTVPEGQVEHWRIETGSLPRMIKRGLKKTDFKPGTEVIVGGYAARDSQLKAAGMVVTFPDREAAGREASFGLGR
jgi:Family of unknown function (DUF6152)